MVRIAHLWCFTLEPPTRILTGDWRFNLNLQHRSIHFQLSWRSYQWKSWRGGCSWICWTASSVVLECRSCLHPGGSWLPSSECRRLLWIHPVFPGCRILSFPSSDEWSRLSPEYNTCTGHEMCIIIAHCSTLTLVWPNLTWSPHSLMMGMLMSSTNTVIFLPAGGPYVVPIRLST